MLKKQVRLFADDERTPPKGWMVARSVKRATIILETRNVIESSLDFWFGLPHQKTGLELVRWMIEKKICPPIVRVHSLGSWDGKRMTRRLKKAFPRKRIFYKPLDKPI